MGYQLRRAGVKHTSICCTGESVGDRAPTHGGRHVLDWGMQEVIKSKIARMKRGYLQDCYTRLLEVYGRYLNQDWDTAWPPSVKNGVQLLRKLGEYDDK